MHKVYVSLWWLSVKSIIIHKVNFTYIQEGITVESRRKVRLL